MLRALPKHMGGTPDGTRGSVLDETGPNGVGFGVMIGIDSRGYGRPPRQAREHGVGWASVPRYI